MPNVTYRKVPHSWCLGPSHKLQKSDFNQCFASCSRSSCSCVQYRTFSDTDTNCRWVGQAEYKGTATSRTGFDAWIREAPPTKTPSGSRARTAEPRLTEAPQTSSLLQTTCSSKPGDAVLKTSDKGPLVTPRFYMHDAAIPENVLLECYAARHAHRPYGWAEDASLWLFRALVGHSHRIYNAPEARLVWSPSLSALSEATGTCNGDSHFARMDAAAKALRTSLTFRLRPQDHFVINGVASATRSPLGELGMLVSRAGFAACLDPKLCGAFKAGRFILLPWPPIPNLMEASLRASVDDEACGKTRVSRRCAPPEQRSAQLNQLRGTLKWLRLTEGVLRVHAASCSSFEELWAAPQIHNPSDCECANSAS